MRLRKARVMALTRSAGFSAPGQSHLAGWGATACWLLTSTIAGPTVFLVLYALQEPLSGLMSGLMPPSVSLIYGLVGMVAGALAGGMVGFGQWLVLRRWLV